MGATMRDRTAPPAWNLTQINLILVPFLYKRAEIGKLVTYAGKLKILRADGFVASS